MKVALPATFAALTLALAVPVPAAASDIITIQQIKMATPQCRDHPGAPVIGRVSGFTGFVRKHSVSFVGCFASMAACEAWRAPVSGEIDGRIVLNNCSYR